MTSSASGRGSVFPVLADVLTRLACSRSPNRGKTEAGCERQHQRQASLLSKEAGFPS